MGCETPREFLHCSPQFCKWALIVVWKEGPMPKNNWFYMRKMKYIVQEWKIFPLTNIHINQYQSSSCRRVELRPPANLILVYMGKCLLRMNKIQLSWRPNVEKQDFWLEKGWGKKPKLHQFVIIFSWKNLSKICRVYSTSLLFWK